MQEATHPRWSNRSPCPGNGLPAPILRMRTRAVALGRGDTRAAGSSCCSERMHERFFSRHSEMETDMFLRTATLVAILLATHVAPALADETPATVRVYALDCGRVEFADLGMFSDSSETRRVGKEWVSTCSTRWAR